MKNDLDKVCKNGLTKREMSRLQLNVSLIGAFGGDISILDSHQRKDVKDMIIKAMSAQGVNIICHNM